MIKLRKMSFCNGNYYNTFGSNLPYRCNNCVQIETCSEITNDDQLNRNLKDLTNYKKYKKTSYYKTIVDDNRDRSINSYLTTYKNDYRNFSSKLSNTVTHTITITTPRYYVINDIVVEFY